MNKTSPFCFNAETRQIYITIQSLNSQNLQNVYNFYISTQDNILAAVGASIDNYTSNIPSSPHVYTVYVNIQELVWIL